MDASYRREPMRGQRDQWLGTIHLATPLSFAWLTLLAVSLAAAIVLFMVFGHYTRRETVSGQLIPSAGLLGVHSPTTGTVTRVFVYEGQAVHRGDRLVEVSGESHSAALGSTQAVIGAQLRAQAGRLRAQLTDQQRSTREQAASLRTKLDMLHQQLMQIDDQIVLLHREIANSRKLINALLPLRKKGYVSVYQVTQQEAALLQQQSQVKELVRQRLDTRQQVNQVQQQLGQLPLDLDSKQAATHQLLSQNAQEMAQNELQRDTMIFSPVDGVVSTLLANQGQAVATEQPLLSILPKDSALQAQLLVPSNAIGFIEPGNQVVMRYQAFPYQKYGQQYGRVISVSRSALSNDEVSSLLGVRGTQSLYRVVVKLRHQFINTYDKSYTLKPGMAISADIMLGRRSLWQLAFEPLYGIKQRLAGDHRGQN